ncbi:acylneuraminate cytidylyltransferase, partial [Nitrosopumilus sp.]|nr:acylneuraminate cytidylyltransferase [Nitrosopumilus sp.]
QISNSKLIDKVIIATTNESEDDVIVEFAKKRNLDYFRGNTNDVLDRYYQCAKKFNLQTIVRVTSDCPLTDPVIIDHIIKLFFSNECDYSTNKLPINSPKCPQGVEVEVFSYQTLEKIWNDAQLASEREHVTPHIYNNPKKFRIISNSHYAEICNLRYTIDKNNDLKLVRTLIKKIQNRPILTSDIILIFKNEPTLFNINAHYIRNEGYFKSTSKN